MINDTKELEKFLKICRKQGVIEIRFGGVSVAFGDLPKKSSEPEESEETQTDELTPEQLAFFSVGGHQP